MRADLAITGARVLTLDGAGCAVGPVDRCDVVVTGDQIVAVGAGAAEGHEPAETVRADGRVVMPAFIDAHTHACYAGDRLDEWRRKMAGATYLELLAEGGGIMSTVRAVRAASRAELAEGLRERLWLMAEEGTAACEVKSGYGLTTADELKMLGAIADARSAWPGRVRMTACIGHAVDPEVDAAAFVDRTIEETLPAVHAAFPEAAIDAYCEEGAWSLDACRRLFERARELGHTCRVHADQFHALGMVEAAPGLGLRSVDHLEATDAAGLERLAASGVFGVMLPVSGFHVDGRYADGRRFIDAGGRLVVATNCNPGSAPSYSVPFAIAIAVRRLGVTVDEAIVAVTRNAADVLALPDAGRIAPGMRADLVMLRSRDETDLAYTVGGRACDAVFIGGRRVSGRAPAAPPA